VAGDQRARGRHADEDRPAPVADRGRGLLAQRGVRLVADDDRVGVGDAAGVAHEPLVGLDRHRPVGRVVGAQQRARDAVLVAPVAQLAVELVDQVAAVREDQDAAGARPLHEAERRDRLAGAGGVLEPEPLAGVRVLRLLGQLAVPGGTFPVLRLLRLVVVVLLAGDAGRGQLERRIRHVTVAVAVALRLGQQRGQRAGQRVDLVGREDGAVGERRLVLGEQPLQPQQQRPLAPPPHGRHPRARRDLGERRVERRAVRRARREQRTVVALRREGLAGERGDARDVVE
jgi:hypothetical protein